MAYATVAGLHPVAGLWSALPALVVYALVGSSRSLSMGPEATTALMTAIAIGPLAAGNPARYAELAAALALLVGVMAAAAWVLRLCFVADRLSRPVLVGYMAGVALIMIAGQLGRVTGVPVTGEDFIGQLRSFARGVDTAQPAILAVAAAVLAFLVLLRWRWPAIPGPLLAVHHPPEDIRVDLRRAAPQRLRRGRRDAQRGRVDPVGHHLAVPHHPALDDAGGGRGDVRRGGLGGRPEGGERTRGRMGCQPWLLLWRGRNAAGRHRATFDSKPDYRFQPHPR